jgi:hypothetical protein
VLWFEYKMSPGSGAEHLAISEALGAGAYVEAVDHWDQDFEGDTWSLTLPHCPLLPAHHVMNSPVPHTPTMMSCPHVWK